MSISVGGPEDYKRFLDEVMDKDVENDRKKKVIQAYKRKYDIKGEIATVNGVQVHIDYLPTIDAMLKAKKRFKEPKEVVGAALFKIEKDECIFLTDSEDPNLQYVYNSHARSASRLAKELYQLNTMHFEFQMTEHVSQVLATSFRTVFGQKYGEWRQSLGTSK